MYSKYKPVIIAESFGKSSNSDKAELFEVLDNLGYQVFYFEDFDVNAKVAPINNKSEMANYKKTINVYALPKK